MNHQQGQIENARQIYQQVLTLKPNHFNSLHLTGVIEYQKANYEKSIELYQKAITFNSSNAACFYNLGNAQKELNQLGQALISYDKSIELNALDAKCFSNRGFVLRELGLFDEALQSFKKSLEIQPDYAGANFNFGELSLLKGNFEDGWKYYEWRLRVNSFKFNSLNFNQPQWLGEQSIKDKTILIHSEQGLGDTIQFIRYIPIVIALGAKVLLQVQHPLFSLFQGLEGVSQWLKKDETLPIFDLHCSLMSLPFVFKTNHDSIPSCTIIKIAPDKNLYWKIKFQEINNLKVGLVWSGGMDVDDPEIVKLNQRRNVPLDYFKTLKNINVTFVNLQKGEPAETEFKEKISRGWDGPMIDDYVSELNDFEDTAALIMNLDLVISVDTSTAHLAATLGKPVWLLNRFDTCWRWLLGRQDSPWYPTLKIYRQSSPGDWGGVMERVREDLLQLTSNG